VERFEEKNGKKQHISLPRINARKLLEIEMVITRNVKIGLIVLFTTIIIITPILYLSFIPQTPPPENENDEDVDPFDLPTLETPVNSINVSLLDYASVMIEANNLRIYIDPYHIQDSNYAEYPADLILITHAHPDHYSIRDIREVETNDTLVVMPERMSYNFGLHNNCLGVIPGDSFQFRGINITAFYHYTASTAHPPERNRTSYIIEIDKFTLYHAGDARYMPEFEIYTLNVDIAFLPIYYDPGFATLHNNLAPVIQMIESITPEYCIPTHWCGDDKETFMQEYVPTLEDDCTVIDLDFYESHVFSN
jgi:L-ascorbate metabolism protein UlaG (beta-lactamase superfamily)